MIHKYLVAFALLGAAASPLAAQTAHAGIEAWQRGDYPGAVAIWRPLAEKGDTDSQFDLGQAYRLGKGVPMNLSAAMVWYQRAAAKGHLDAEAELGLLLFTNGDHADGLKWLKLAAEQGEARSLLVYGTALVNGDGVPRNPVLGYAYVSRAAAQGLDAAKQTLADLDKMLPLAARQKGVEMASAKAKTAPPPGSKPAPPAASAKPVQTAAAKPKPVQLAVAKPKPAPPTPPQSAVAKPKTVPAPAAPAPAALSATGGWRIQLGAFSQKGSAETLYRKLSGSLAGRQAYYIPVGAITRLQVGPYPTRAAAQAACGALHGQACFPVAAK